MAYRAYWRFKWNSNDWLWTYNWTDSNVTNNINYNTYNWSSSRTNLTASVFQFSTSTPFTISWLFQSSSTTNQQTLHAIYWTATNADNVLWIQATTWKLYARCWDTSVSAVVNPATNYVDWKQHLYHKIYNNSNKTLYLYVDWVLVWSNQNNSLSWNFYVAGSISLIWASDTTWWWAYNYFMQGNIWTTFVETSIYSVWQIKNDYAYYKWFF
jgi:hypothetical protein